MIIMMLVFPLQRSKFIRETTVFIYDVQNIALQCLFRHLYSYSIPNYSPWIQKTKSEKQLREEAKKI